MRIDVGKLKPGKSLTIKEKVTLDGDKYKCHYPLLSIDGIDAEAKATAYDEFIEVELNVNAKVTLECSYSLEPFGYTIRDSINTEFVLYEEDMGEDTVLIENNEIVLDSYIYDLISMNVPSRPVKKGASMPKSGSGYRVLSEDEYNQEQANKTDSRFDKLLDLEFDEDDK